ncbi:MAG: DUF2271 domain-containing protein [Owenweeksia sp.]
MVRRFSLLLPVLSIILLMGFTTHTSTYKCMIQMINYKGEGAYVIVSLINPQGNYEKTLYIQGDDPEWYHEITEWWGYFGKAKRQVDGITGATLAGGKRTVSILEIEDSKIDAGYKIRFETSVEEQKYHVRDVEFPLTSESVKSKVEGSGYIRYVRLMPQ